MGHSVCKMAGLQAHNDYQNLNRVVCMRKQHVLAYIPNYLIVSLHFFGNDICLLQGLHTTKNHVIWNGPAVKILW